jgi:hypothetical protein
VYLETVFPGVLHGRQPQQCSRHSDQLPRVSRGLKRRIIMVLEHLIEKSSMGDRRNQSHSWSMFFEYCVSPCFVFPNFPGRSLLNAPGELCVYLFLSMFYVCNWVSQLAIELYETEEFVSIWSNCMIQYVWTWRSSLLYKKTPMYRD